MAGKGRGNLGEFAVDGSIPFEIGEMAKIGAAALTSMAASGWVWIK